MGRSYAPKRLHGKRALEALLARDDVCIAHMDTGATGHPCFGGAAGGLPAHIALASDCFQPERPDASDPLPDKVDVTDWPGHGTRTLSVLAAKLPGTLEGYAPGARVRCWRVADSPVFDLRRSATEPLGVAIDEALQDPSVKVISISMGIPGPTGFPDIAWPYELGASQRLAEAVDRAYEAGVLVVAAAGQIIDRVTFPARFSRTIAVGGVKANDRIWHRYGGSEIRRVDVWALADGIDRANMLGPGSAPTACYSKPHHADDEAPPHSGTSYATVAVAAAAAMWLAKHEAALLAAFGQRDWHVVESFREALKRTRRKIPGSGSLESGILDLDALVQADPPLGGLHWRPRATGQT